MADQREVAQDRAAPLGEVVCGYATKRGDGRGSAAPRSA